MSWTIVGRLSFRFTFSSIHYNKHSNQPGGGRNVALAKFNRFVSQLYRSQSFSVEVRGKIAAELERYARKKIGGLRFVLFYRLIARNGKRTNDVFL